MDSSSVLLNNAGTLSAGNQLVAVCHTSWDGILKDPNSETRNGQRLASCWNACIGLEIPEDMPPGFLVKFVKVVRDLCESSKNSPDPIRTRVGTEELERVTDMIMKLKPTP